MIAGDGAVRVRGECMCHGVVVEGTAGTVAQPEPYFHTDLLTGKRVKCWAVMDDDGSGPHDVPLAWPAGVDRLTNQKTEITP